MTIEMFQEVVMKNRTGTKKILFQAGLAMLMLGCAGFGWAASPGQAASLQDAVRHELMMLPYYDVFDTLTFSIDSSNAITLGGRVLRPLLKREAEAAVRSVPGVTQVRNDIEILPLSTFDNRIRVAAYKAIFWNPGFEKYAIRAHSPIKIIVKNGNVTLEGFVDSALDRQVAFMAVRLLPGIFSVTNNLTVS
jgi:hypothetical protein